MLGIFSISCGNPSEPVAFLTGVWVGQPVSPLGDSLRLVIVDSAGQVQGYGRVYPITAPDFRGVGTRTGSHLDLTLCRFGTCMVLRADLDLLGDRLRGTLGTGSNDDSAIEFTRSHPVVAGLPGTWVLTRISDSSALPDIAITDTVLLVGDGHFRRFVSRVSGCAATSFGFYRRQANLAIIDYLDFGLPSIFDCGIRPSDTLTVIGPTLVRRTVVSGVIGVDETYDRR